MNGTGKVAIVTGAGTGIGKSVALALLKAGYAVALAGRRAEPLEATAAEGAALGGRTLAVPTDVADPAAVRALFARTKEAFGRLDLLFNNAGLFPPRGLLEDLTYEEWKAVVDVNLTGTFLGARAAARVMREGGRIIFTGSVLGDRPRRGLAAYSASKAGLVAMAKALAQDLADSAITVNVVAPGWFDSPLAEGWMGNGDLAQANLGHTALGRWGASTDLPGAFLFLASDAASFVTGTVLHVDGGYLLA